ncbi:hypothetical protein VTJ83DRAFT_1647 [Remersonia thermophila]|uniref:Secreted protein n=1 Tax=Remersonia thermophila TaxID=72144 RepID=A0ABR4DGJ0_9PEZI
MLRVFRIRFVQVFANTWGSRRFGASLKSYKLSVIEPARQRTDSASKGLALLVHHHHYYRHHHHHHHLGTPFDMYGSKSIHNVVPSP